MLSSDKNVETIAQIVGIVKHYLGLQGEYLKLDVIDKFVRLLAAIAMTFLFMILIICMSFLFLISLRLLACQYIGNAPAFVVVGCIHLFTFILFYYKRKSWVERAPSSTSLSTSS